MKSFIIGITGGSGSGKTTFIKKLANSFSPKQLCIISQDDYYRPREEQKKDENGIINFDLPESIDDRTFLNDIQKLIQGQAIRKQEYTYNNKSAQPKIITFHPAPIIIVEGLFVFHYKKIANLFDLKVFIHSKENLKVIRRIKRDKIERNYPLDDVLYRYENHVLPTFEKYILPYKEKADIIINNNKGFEMGLEVFKNFLAQKLKKPDV